MSQAPLSTHTRQELASLVTSLDEHLRRAGASQAEQAFGLGCAVSLVPLGLLMLLAFILGARTWISLGLVALAGILLATALSALAAQRARRNAMQRTSQLEVADEIEQFLTRHQLSRTQFEQLAAETLPGSSPLIQWITSPGERHASPKNKT